MVQIDENVREADVFVIQPSCPPVSDGILELLITIDALKHASAGAHHRGDPLLPLRALGQEGPAAHLDHRAADGGSPRDRGRRSRADDGPALAAGAGLLPRADRPAARGAHPLRLPARTAATCANHVLVAGDVGESKDVGRYARRLGLPIAIVDKRRFGDDERARAVNLIGDVGGKDALIVDDEVASGGTLIEAASFVLERGAVAVDACAVHAGAVGQAVQRIAGLAPPPAPDDRYHPAAAGEAQRRRSTLHSVARLFADAIRAIHDGSSVSRLFR